MRDVVILGSTGSIGVQALEIIAAHPDLFRVVALSAGGKNTDLLIEQAKRFKVPVVGVALHAERVRENLPGVQVIDGPQASTVMAHGEIYAGGTGPGRSLRRSFGYRCARSSLRNFVWQSESG